MVDLSGTGISMNEAGIPPMTQAGMEITELSPGPYCRYGEMEKAEKNSFLEVTDMSLYEISPPLD